MKEPLFLEPVFQERIWGGTALRNTFGYSLPSDQTGECWAISGHPNGQSKVKNGVFAGRTIGDLWENTRELFGSYSSPVFPLLTKILDANADLSVQVHPDDSYAVEHENGEMGKTECWYIIDCDEEAELIFGHTAQTKEEFIEHVEKGNWNELLRRVSVKPGDFFYVPSGTIHALCKGTLILETQQSSDLTYRVYDYDRKDAEGNTRELHIDRSIAVTTIPHQSARVEPTVEKHGDAEIKRFVEAEYFTVYKWNLEGKASFEQDKPFLLVSVLNGSGVLKADGKVYTFEKGDHFILPAGFGTFGVEGQAELIVSHV
ncbi:mannose-6-phosphate isomerase, class I [Bacillus infantis]|uniref:mannose-6-phosphate isomerase, class I n=1 Tax=Bacillus infantis TaxID=324767 RepID=UPI001CD5477A|nr:mannose-6-phosphate isomerase, class I [Bacillus infantis]MCA1040871.1 mannose-6-phosphate isomerase, class I [Bacillus infantis]